MHRIEKTDNDMQFSVIIPVFNRPAELDELLDSLTRQTNRQFEVIVVEDGSDQKSDTIVGNTKIVCRLHTLKSRIRGRASRNAGAQRARYGYLIFRFRLHCSRKIHSNRKQFSHEAVLRCVWWSRQGSSFFYDSTKAINTQ